MIDGRRPTIANPKLVKRRVVVLERVTMRPAPGKRPVTRQSARPGTKAQWRAGQGIAAAALIAAVPLAHASGPDRSPVDIIDAPPAIEVALVPEPLEPAPFLPLSDHEAIGEEPVFAKVDGLKPNPYEGPKPGRRAAKIVRKTHRVPRVNDEPVRVSELKANPYE